MDILVLCPSNPFEKKRGIERYILAALSDKPDWLDHILIVCLGRQKKPYRVERRGDRIEILEIYARYLRSFLDYVRRKEGFLKILMKKVHFDLVWAHGERDMLLALKVFKRDVPILLHFHNTLIMRNCARGLLKEKDYGILDLIIKEINKRKNVFSISINPLTTLDLENLGISEEKVFNVPSPVLPKFLEEKLSYPSKIRRAVVVGRYDKMKSFEEVFRYSSLFDEIVIVGAGTERIGGLGEVSDEELKDIIKNSGFLIDPSKDRNYPLACLEANAMGRLTFSKNLVCSCGRMAPTFPIWSLEDPLFFENTIRKYKRFQRKVSKHVLEFHTPSRFWKSFKKVLESL